MIALGADSAGFALKEDIKLFLKEKGVDYKDFGIYAIERCDYPLKAIEPCKSVQSGECTLALLFCGTGIGISMAANKHRGIRAAHCSDYYSAKYSRLHNDANVLCLGGRVIGTGLAREIVTVFLTTRFERGRHMRRVTQIADIEGYESGK